ncbi:lens fiber membrane intrinsic protein-like isoform X2 [Tachysurus fulvidraco]|nr:lens fiber membrane intrinsic protein-like isoform X2 [Tachysurus fulvidraco]
MNSLLGGGIVCAGVGNILLAASTATDYWMQYHQASGYMHQGLWHFCVPGKCIINTENIGFLNGVGIYMIMANITGILGMFLGIMAFFNYNTVVRLNRTFFAAFLYYLSFFYVLPAMVTYTLMTVYYYEKQYENWRFSWSYLTGWVSVVFTFFSGIFFVCARRIHSPTGTEV